MVLRNCENLDIPQFGGLRAAQHAVADDVKFGDQFVGIRAGQRRGIDFCGQQNHRGHVRAAFQAVFLESPGKIEHFPVMAQTLQRPLKSNSVPFGPVTMATFSLAPKLPLRVS